jgi:peptide deformylase
VKAQDEQGRPVQIPACGLLARVLQHEIDHLDGILFIDRIPAAAAPAR